MGRGRLAGRGARGGASIQALRRARPRLIRAALAAAALAGTAAYPAALADRFGEALAALGAVGAATMLVGAALRLMEAVPVALTLVAAEYATFLALREDGGIEAGAPVVAAGLVLAAELAYTAGEPPLAPASPGLRAWRALRLVAPAAGGAAVAAVLLYLSVADIEAGLAVELLGIVAAAAALGLVASLARRA